MRYFDRPQSDTEREDIVELQEFEISIGLRK